MPVTAKLSKAFYHRLGEQIANELVDWFNSVDATYRADLKELNELNWTRFEAKLDQRVTEVDSRIDRLAADLRGEMKSVKSELLAWMFGFWVTSTLTLAGLLLIVIREIH